jgi:glutaredoxin
MRYIARVGETINIDKICDYKIAVKRLDFSVVAIFKTLYKAQNNFAFRKHIDG